MTLTLTLANVEKLENNQSTRLVLDRHGALIGRSPQADWSLPDPKNYISNSHCEIAYRNGHYILSDRSTNGTFVNNARERLSAPYTLVNGDEFGVGHYRILVRISDEAVAAPEPANPPPAPEGWSWDTPAEPKGADAAWGDIGVETKPPPQWDMKPEPQWQFDAPGPAISGRGPLRENFAPPRAVEPSRGEDVWSRFAASNAIDWEKGGFGAPVQTSPRASPSPAKAPSAPATPAPPPIVEARPQSPAVSVLELKSADAAWAGLLAAAGLKQADLRASPSQTGAAAGTILLRLMTGLIVLLEARARAKAELGAVSTSIELTGNNPLKFTRDPMAAVARLLNPPERGYMDAELAVEDAFKDLQAHQMATLAAMQGALRATLTRFSPEAIRRRAESRGLHARILPGGRAAALWEAYEREFEGVVQGSDEAFMDTFARAFRDAYQKACAEMRK